MIDNVFNEGFYVKGINGKCKKAINICIIYNKPSLIQIVSQGPKNCYQIDLADIPAKLQTDENKKYLLNIIDTFSKFDGSYI